MNQKPLEVIISIAKIDGDIVTLFVEVDEHGRRDTEKEITMKLGDWTSVLIATEIQETVTFYTSDEVA